VVKQLTIDTQARPGSDSLRTYGKLFNDLSVLSDSLPGLGIYGKLFNHLSVLSESLPGQAWVSMVS
jgi:hypothetical protein